MNQDFSSTSFPTLETKRLWLRQTAYEDTEALFAIFSDPKVTQFHNLDTFACSDDAIELIKRQAKGFESGRGIRWGITRKPDDYLIGTCGFTWHQEANAAEVGYELASQNWRQGVMSEALRAILTYGFEVREIQFVIARVMLENVASKKLMQMLGFQSQGVLKNSGFWKGEHHDLEQFKLMRSSST